MGICGAIVSVVKDHSGEELNEIIERKANDIRRCNFTLWVDACSSVNLSFVRSRDPFFQNDVKVFFISGSGRQRVSEGTHFDVASKYVEDDNVISIPNCVGKVTGRIGKKTTAFLLEELEICANGESVDLQDYEDVCTEKYIKFNQSRYTAIVRNATDLTSGEKVKSNRRQLFAIGRCKFPYWTEVYV